MMAEEEKTDDDVLEDASRWLQSQKPQMPIALVERLYDEVLGLREALSKTSAVFDKLLASD